MREFKHFCQEMRSLFKNKKTFENFIDFNESFYADLHAGKPGWQVISQSSKASYESIQNFMTEASWDADDFNETRIEYLQSNSKLAMKPGGIISLDDVEKICYGESNEYVDYQYSSSIGKPVKSIKFVNTHYHDKQKNYHLLFEPYQINKNVVLSPKILNCADVLTMAAKFTSNQKLQETIAQFLANKKSLEISLEEIKKISQPLKLPKKEQKSMISKFKKLSPDFKSKIDIAVDFIETIGQKWGIEGKIFIMDCWYTSKRIFKKITERKAFFVAQSRNNRIISTKELGKVSVAGLVTSKIEALTQINSSVSGYCCKATSDGFDVTVVIIKNEKCVRVFLTNLIFDEQNVLAFLTNFAEHVKSHWTIEEGHKKMRALGFDKFIATSIKAIKKHIALALFRYTFLVYLSIKDSWKIFVNSLKEAGKSVLNGISKQISLLVLKQRSKLKVQKGLY